MSDIIEINSSKRAQQQQQSDQVVINTPPDERLTDLISFDDQTPPYFNQSTSPETTISYSTTELLTLREQNYNIVNNTTSEAIQATQSPLAKCPGNDEEEEEKTKSYFTSSGDLQGFDVRCQPNSLPQLSFANLPRPANGFLCTVTYVESQARFFVAPLAKNDQFEHFVDLIQEVGDRLETENVRLPTYANGMPCLARFADDGLFCRAKILAVGNDTLHISYVDFGNTAFVPFCEVWPLPEVLASFPAQALECGLSGLDSRNLTGSVVAHFVRHFPEGKVVRLKAIRRKSRDTRWLVELYHRHGGEMVNERFLGI